MSDARAELPIEQQLRKDIHEAQRSRDQLRLDTLRMALGAIHNLEVARTDRSSAQYGHPLTEEDGLHVLEQEIKKRNQAIGFYEKGGRQDLVQKEQQELDIIQSYLQTSRMSEAEIRGIIASLIEQHGKEFRTIMPLSMKELKGKVDGGSVQRIVREMTAQ